MSIKGDAGYNQTLLLQIAPYAKNVSHAASILKVSRLTLYRWFDKSPVLRKHFDDALNTKPGEPIPDTLLDGKISLEPEKDKARVPRKRPDTKRIVVTLPNGDKGKPRKGKKQMRYTLEERMIVVEAICKMYENGLSIQDAAKTAKIHVTLFYKWIDQNSVNFIPEAYERYKEARRTYLNFQTDLIVHKARQTILEHMDEKEFTETTIVGRPDETGKVIPYTVRKLTKIRDNSLRAAQVALSMSRDSNQRGKQTSDQSKEAAAQREYHAMPLTELDDEIALIEAQIKNLSYD